MIRYQVISGYKGHEWTTSTRYYRSYERALKGAIKSKRFFGNATLLKLQKNEYGYELLESKDI